MIHDICLLCVNVFVIIRIFMLWLSLYMHSTHYTLVFLLFLLCTMRLFTTVCSRLSDIIVTGHAHRSFVLLMMSNVAIGHLLTLS